MVYLLHYKEGICNCPWDLDCGTYPQGYTRYYNRKTTIENHGEMSWSKTIFVFASLNNQIGILIISEISKRSSILPFELFTVRVNM